MAYSERYIRRTKFFNTDKLYEKPFQERGLKRVLQYNSPSLRYPTPEEIAALQTVSHEWTMGDHYWKLSSRFYGDAQLWWVIAWFNQMPTEGFVSYGDVIEIPMPLEKVFQILGV